MKRKQFFISAIITLLLALFAGCNQSFSPALRKADQVLLQILRREVKCLTVSAKQSRTCR